MPVPGPRTQTRSLPGYANPGGETPDRFRLEAPRPTMQPGRSPGTTLVSLRGNVLAAGTVRRLWRQSINYIAGQSPYSWTDSAPSPGRPEFAPPRGFEITRALRYMTRSLYIGGGVDNSRYSGLHTAFRPRVRSKPATTGAGAVRSRPTVRNRLTSFGSRVQPINPRVPAASDGGQ